MRHASRKIGVWSSRFTGCWFCVVGRRAEAGLPGFPCRSFVPAVRRLSSVTEVPAANLIVSAVGATRRRLFWWKRGPRPLWCAPLPASGRGRREVQVSCPGPAPGPNPGVLFRLRRPVRAPVSCSGPGPLRMTGIPRPLPPATSTAAVLRLVESVTAAVGHWGCPVPRDAIRTP